MKKSLRHFKPRFRKPPSTAQLWARERNWNKARLTSIIQTLLNMSRQDSTVSGEFRDYGIVANLLRGRLDNWNNANKQSKKIFIAKNRGG